MDGLVALGRRMEQGDWFLVGVVGLQLGAVLNYIWKRRWPEAVVYLCYSIAQIMLLLLSLKARA